MLAAGYVPATLSGSLSFHSFSFLLVFLALLDVLVEDGPKIVPAALRDQDAVPEVALDLADRDVPPLLVLLAGEVEVLVLDAHVAVVWCGRGAASVMATPLTTSVSVLVSLTVAVVVLVQQLL